ncbi:MAG: hypothetical protein Q8O88_03750 [bacterium]|nr:hypothetical protein [bacterium]
MAEQKTIIIMGIGKGEEINATLREELITQHGANLIILSESEANEKGILKGNVPSISQFKITAPPIVSYPDIFYDPHLMKNDCKKGWKK